MPGVTRGVLDTGVSGVTAGLLEVEDSVGVRAVEAGVLNEGVSVEATIGISGVTGGVLEVEDAVETSEVLGVRGQSGTSGAQLISVEVDVT